MDAIATALRARELSFIAQVAKDYNLPVAELTEKYYAKKPATKKPKAVVVEGAAVKCCGITAKKEQCKFGPLPGEKMCKRHMTASATDGGPHKKSHTGTAPVHNHEMDYEIHEGCPVCETSGSLLAPTPNEFEMDDDDM